MSKEIISFKQFNESINDKNLFKAVFMVGAPGSGKSFVSGKMFGGMGAVTLNSDDIFEMALFNNHITGNPQHFADARKVMEVMKAMKSGKVDKVFSAEYMARPELQAFRNERVKPLTSKRLAFWVNGMLPIIIDGTGKNINRLKKQVEFLESIGYDVSGVYLNVSKEKSLERNRNRYRSVDEKMLIQTWEQIQQLGTSGEYKSLFGKKGRGFKEVDAMIDLGQKTPTVEVQLKQLQKAGTAFVAAPLKNPLGKEILKTLKATKGKYYQDAFPEEADFRNLASKWMAASWSKK